MSKPNREQAPEEFQYTFACKKMLHELEYLRLHLDTAKGAGMQGISQGALNTIEIRMHGLRTAIYNALKTV